MKLSDVLDPASTAILVVDMQNDYCSPGGSVAQRGHDIGMITNRSSHIPTLTKTQTIQTQTRLRLNRGCHIDCGTITLHRMRAK